MRPEAKSEDLLYVPLDSGRPSQGTSIVNVFSWKTGKLVGRLTGFDMPVTPCADNAGNIFIPDDLSNGKGVIYEYAHGGTAPIKTLNDSLNGAPGSCSVDSTTGNLAVMSGNYPYGGVLVYANASGNPQVYVDSAMYYYWGCTYDNSGNLFIDGFTEGSAFTLGELPKDSNEFTTITLNRSMSGPGNLQWDGQYLAVQDWGGSGIYRFAISGSSGTLEGSEKPKDFVGHVQFWIFPLVGQGKSYVAGFYSNGGEAKWKYPGSGKPVARYRNSTSWNPGGLTVSAAQ